jgi:hypothetical protein
LRPARNGVVVATSYLEEKRKRRPRDRQAEKQTDRPFRDVGSEAIMMVRR